MLVPTLEVANPSVYGIQLSTGRVAYARPLPAGASDLVVSPDQRFLAMSIVDRSRGSSMSDVMDLATGATVARLAGSAVGFSGDDQRVALDTDSGAGPASVVELRTGRTIWRTDPGSTIASLQDVRPMPGGGAMAFTITGDGLTPRVVLVRQDGTAVVVARSAELLTLGSFGGPG